LGWGGARGSRNEPELKLFDRFGNRIDEVVYDPSYHRFMSLSVEHELHALPWNDPQPGAHVARGAMFMTLARCEPGHGCPISMTYSVVPALRQDPEIADEWLPLATATHYDPRLVPAAEKGAAIFGMAMTEKQGGSDVRANTTTATPTDEDGMWSLVGHKWFCSAPMSDAFLVLAQTDEGLSCFLLPRVLPDGTRNAFHIQRLKDKLGNRSNASSEVELRGALARMVGEPGRGVPTIIHMVGHTRLDCVLGSTAGMRGCVEQAIHHARHRAAFGSLLVDKPLMRNVLADLAIESEAATVTAMRLARSYDETAESAEAKLFQRLATAVAKYWICKRAPGHAAEALETLGGNGFTEEWPLARAYRDSPLNSIWEGSGNVICLDVLRALSRSPETLDVFFDELEQSGGADPRLDAHIAETKAEFTRPEELESRARRVVERMALALQGSLLVRHAPEAVSDAFCASRLGGDAGLAYGTLPAGTRVEEIVDRHAAPVS